MRWFFLINLLEKFLDAKWMRNEVISNNIANVDTPGYKRSDVVFEEVLRNFKNNKNIPILTTNDRHFSNIDIYNDLKYKITTQDDRVFRNDANNVDIDKEMSELTKNTLSYNVIAEQLQMQLRLLNTAINEGRK